jgi:hypothetical protein
MTRFDFDFARILGKQKSEKANNDCLLKGRITRPKKGLDDKEFEYVPSYRTDLTETFRKGREQQQ